MRSLQNSSHLNNNLDCYTSLKCKSSWFSGATLQALHFKLSLFYFPACNAETSSMGDAISQVVSHAWLNMLKLLLRAAARHKQPFLMHKMAFHRARVLSTIECSSTRMALPQQLPGAGRSRIADSCLRISDTIAPPLRPFRAEVFLPYALPGRACTNLQRGQGKDASAGHSWTHIQLIFETSLQHCVNLSVTPKHIETDEDACEAE